MKISYTNKTIEKNGKQRIVILYSEMINFLVQMNVTISIKKLQIC
jgi:hypothetical protein